MSQSESSKCGKCEIYRQKSKHNATKQLTIAARFLSKEYSWSLALATLLIFAIHAPAQADEPCDGEEDAVAQPIARALQSNASAFNPDGRFEVTLQTSTGTTFPTDVYLRHVRGGSELFRTVNRVQSEIRTAKVGLLPAGEGSGFSLQISEGGSGYNQMCTYGFRFQNGAVFYRTLAANAASRNYETGIWSGYIFPGEVTNWKSVLVQAQQPPPQTARNNSPMAPSAGATTPNEAATNAPVTSMTLKVLATALGQSATNGGTLTLKVPVNVGIWVAFAATAPPMVTFTFSWLVDGNPVGDGAQILRRLSAGEHSVELRAWESGNYSNSTPATIAAAKTPNQIGRVTVNVVEEPKWSCLGRLGAGCNDGPVKNFVFTTGATVSVACRGKPNQVCISSLMSVGAIKHDRCCEERMAMGMSPGYWCDNLSDKEDPAVCAAEWAQAELDSKVTYPLVPGFGIKRFDHLWVYPPEGSDGPSSGRVGWWQHIVDSGVIMSYSDLQPDKQELFVCKSGSASKVRIGGMTNSDMAAGPMFSQTHAWICDSLQASTTPQDTVQNCSLENSARSTNSTTPTEMEFINNSAQAISTYWLDYDGRRVFYNFLNPGQSYVQQTYLTHPWIVTNSNHQCLGVYLPKVQRSKVTIR